MFRKAIIAVAAAGLFGCAHSRETQTTAMQAPAETAANPAPVRKAAVKTDEARAARDETKARQPDNTGVNVRDRDDKTLTPMDQGGATSDLKITQEIRKAVVGADGLSFTAKNVKIITRDANVTLRGPVKTSSEKQRIDELARGCAGVTKVDNQLEVESNN